MSAQRRTPSRRAQVRYLDAGLRVLAEHGHPGLKLATVCEQVGATSGSFYYAFPSWTDFTAELIDHWRVELSTRLIVESSAITSPPERLARLLQIGLDLPHQTEGAIRVWASHDARVRSVVAEVDAERLATIAEAYEAVGHDPQSARHYATAAMYLLIGHEAGSLGGPSDLAWAFRVMLDHALAASSEPGSAAGAPPLGPSVSASPRRPRG